LTTIMPQSAFLHARVCDCVWRSFNYQGEPAFA
jgi:hypothetical protein